MRTLNRLLLVSLIAVSPLPAIAADYAPSTEPEVTLRTEGEQTIPGYRTTGVLVALQVTQKGERTIKLHTTRGLNDPM